MIKRQSFKEKMSKTMMVEDGVPYLVDWRPAKSERICGASATQKVFSISDVEGICA